MVLAHSKSSVRDSIKRVLIITIIITITTLYPDEIKRIFLKKHHLVLKQICPPYLYHEKFASPLPSIKFKE